MWYKNSILFKGIISCLLISAFTQCNKSDSHAPSITITSPQNNQVFTTGQTVHILAEISDSSKINTVHLRVTNLTTGEEFIHIEQMAGVTNYTFDQTFVTSEGTGYTIEVEANNYKGNDALVDINIKSQ